MLRNEEKAYGLLSPFQLKNRLLALAKGKAKEHALPMLNAGRGNPNWLATTPREAFFTLGQFAIEEARRDFKQPHLAGMPTAGGIAARFEEWASRHAAAPGLAFLHEAFAYGVRTLGFDTDAFVYELTDAIVADRYPYPERMLKHAEQVVQAYLSQELCAGRPPSGTYDLFAVEGATAGICYIFNSLMENGILHKHDTIALGVPAFTPYLEIPKLSRYEFRTVEIAADEHDGWQYPDVAIDKLADPSIKAFFITNPSNPASYAIRRSTIDRLVQLVETTRRDLILITDDVYGTFVNDFRSLSADLPRNTICVYSFSKYFGCTGWRLGVIALHEGNVLDEMLRTLPEADHQQLNRRYSSLTLEPEKLKFIDRLVADSRQVALNHTAGLSTPQQAQMALFALLALLDGEGLYKRTTQAIIRTRLRNLYQGLGIAHRQDPLEAGYYATIDLEPWLRQEYGADFVAFLQRTYEPLDIVFRLAEEMATVVLNGGGFDAPEWSIRVSLANLPDEDYVLIGRNLRKIIHEYLAAWQESQRLDPAWQPAMGPADR